MTQLVWELRIVEYGSSHGSVGKNLDSAELAPERETLHQLLALKVVLFVATAPVVPASASLVA